MRFQLPLSYQVPILVTLPLVVQLASFGWLTSLQNQAEDELKQATRAKRISDAVNEMSNDTYDIISEYGMEQSLSDVALTSGRALEHVRKIQNDYAELKKLTENDSKAHAMVVSSEAAAHRAIDLVLQMRDSEGRAGEAERDKRKPMWRELRSVLVDVTYRDLSKLGEEQRQFANRSPEIQAQYRKKAQHLMIAVAILNFALTTVAAIILTKNITQRLARVSDNTYKLASNLPLNPVLNGTDEIARLDQVFHSMADELKEANRKERAIFENARDVIFSIDKSAKFKEVNRASLQIFGFEPNELVGTQFADLVAPDEGTKTTLEYLESVKANSSAKPLELRIQKKDKSVVDLLLSARWSPEEETIYCVAHDISDRRQVEKLRQELLAMVTHDLRNPLSTLKNVVGLLQSDKFGKLDHQGQEFLGMADRSIGRMITLTSDLLDMEKVRAGSLKLARVDTPIGTLFDECKDAMTPLANELGVALIFETSGAIVPVDGPAISRVLENLVGNALKFSPAKAVVHIYAVSFGKEIHVSVADQGPGIPKQNIETIFERFQKAEGTIPRKSEGSGLGLAICKDLVELHRGRIWVESQEGKGSIFTFSLPLSA
jgi:PAS domain S-box-containing protein